MSYRISGEDDMGNAQTIVLGDADMPLTSVREQRTRRKAVSTPISGYSRTTAGGYAPIQRTLRGLLYPRDTTAPADRWVGGFHAVTHRDLLPLQNLLYWYENGEEVTLVERRIVYFNRPGTTPPQVTYTNRDEALGTHLIESVDVIGDSYVGGFPTRYQWTLILTALTSRTLSWLDT